jgi:hypothetical protein
MDILFGILSLLSMLVYKESKLSGDLIFIFQSNRAETKSARHTFFTNKCIPHIPQQYIRCTHHTQLGEVV